MLVTPAQGGIDTLCEDLEQDFYPHDMNTRSDGVLVYSCETYFKARKNMVSMLCHME